MSRDSSCEANLLLLASCDITVLFKLVFNKTVQVMVLLFTVLVYIV